MKLNWRESLTPALKIAKSLAILGIGSPLNSDDAAGILLIEELNKRNPDKNRVLLIAGGSAPENFTGVISDFAPSLLLVIDAAHLGLQPGQVALLAEEELEGAGFSTHMLPFSIMLQYLKRRGLTKALLLGIEPQRTDFGLEISPAMRRALADVADFLAGAI